MSEKGKGQLVLLVAERRGDFLKERFVASVIFHDVLDPRDFALQAELRCSCENAAKPFFRQIFQRRLTTARSCQRDICGERVRQSFRIDSHLRHVAIRFRAGEKGAIALMNEDVQDRVVEGRVRGVSVRFPAAIGQVELNGAADRIARVKPDDSVGEIRTGGAIPSAKLNDLNVIAGDGTESSAEVAGKPAGLQFQFAGSALRRKERAFVDARGIAQLGITIGKQHGGGGEASIGGFGRLATKNWSRSDFGLRIADCGLMRSERIEAMRRRLLEPLDARSLSNWLKESAIGSRDECDRRTICRSPSAGSGSALDLDVRDRFGRQCLDSHGR